MREKFDPVTWRESQRKHLEELLGSGQLDRQTYLEALGEVERRFGEMVDLKCGAPLTGFRRPNGTAPGGEGGSLR